MADIEKHKAIAKEHERVRAAITPSIEALMADPADLGAVEQFNAVLQAEMPYPSDLFRGLIEHVVKWYDETLLQGTTEDQHPAFRAAQAAMAAIGKSLETPDPETLLKSEAELRDLGVKYSRRADGMIEVAGSIDLIGSIETLPDLSNVIVIENFFVGGNDLGTLKGTPFYVGGTLSVSGNALNGLAGVTAYVGGDFIAAMNLLTDLRGGPSFVGGTYSAMGNLLTTVEGIPAELNGVVILRENRLLKHLEHAPKKFAELQTDFGNFNSAEEIPEELRLSPETRDVNAREFRALMVEVTKHAGGLSRAIAAPKTARFARKP